MPKWRNIGKFGHTAVGSQRHEMALVGNVSEVVALFKPFVIDSAFRNRFTKPKICQEAYLSQGIWPQFESTSKLVNICEYIVSKVIRIIRPNLKPGVEVIKNIA